MNEASERKANIAMRIFQVAMIVLLAAGWILIRFAGVDNRLVMIVFFSICAAGLVAVQVFKTLLRRREENPPPGDPQ